MSVCPNVSSKEWKDLVSTYGEDGAYKRWLQNGKEIPGITNVAMGNNATLIKDLQKISKFDVVINPDLDTTAKLINTKNEERIEINPNNLQSEEDIHEYGHVFVDLLGGTETPVIRAGRNRLKNSDLEKSLREKHPRMDENTFQQELLAVAMTKEANEIWKTDLEKRKAASNWTSAFLKNVRRTLGINEETAKKLAKESLKTRINKEKPKADIEEELYGSISKKPKVSKTPVSDRTKSLAEEALGIVAGKIEILKRKIETNNIGQAVALAQLIDLRKSLEKDRADLALAQFVQLAGKQTQVILEKFQEFEKDPSSINLKTLQYLHAAMKAFDSDLLDAISEDVGKENKGIKDELDTILISQARIHKKFKGVAAETLKEEFGPNLFKKIDAIFARKAEIEFQKKDREKESPEKKKRREKYIAEYLIANEAEINAAKQKKLDTFLTTIEKDISTMDAIVNNPKDMNSDIIREAVKLFDRSDFEVQEQSVFIARKAEAIYKKYREFVGIKNNQKEFYAPILDVAPDNGEIIPRLAPEGSAKWAAIKTSGGEYKGTPVEEMYDFLTELSVESDSKLPPRARLNGQLPVMNKNTFERVGDNGLFTAIKEGTLDIWKLRKEDTESGQLEDDSEEGKKEKVKASMDDTVKVLSTQAGEEKKIIPVHFRGKIKETDRSYDVMSLFVLDAHQANDYASKTELAATVEVLLQMVGEAKVVERVGFLGRKKTNLSKDKGGAAQTKPKQQISNTYKALERVIENRLYGIQTTGDAKTAKWSKKIKSYVSIINLFGNYLSAGANFTQGMAMVFMEGAGGQFYGLDNVMRAERKYWKSIPSNVADASRHRAKSKTNLLRELFNARSDWTVLENDFNKNNGLKRNANMGTGLAFNSAAEHSVQSIGMYAVLDNIKVKDKDGNYITKEGTVTKDRKKAMSLDEAYEVGYQHMKTGKTISREAYDKLSANEKNNYMDGVLHLNEKVASTDRTKDEGTFEISQVLRRVNRDLFGNYDPKNKSALEAHAIGSLFGHMRQWMVPGFKKRFKGGHALYIRDKENAQKIFGIKTGIRTIRSDELRDVDLDFNVETEAFEEGMYISTMRWVGVMLQDARDLKFKVLSESWKDLTELEKNNIKRTATELAMAAAAYISYVLLSAALDDDDDEDSTVALLATFYSRRLLAELMTYTNPMEWARTFRSPAVTLSLLENVIKALIQTTTAPTELYDRGPNKDKNKAARLWRRVTPLKFMDRDIEETLKWLKRGY